MKTSSESLGHVSCSLPGRVVAGSYRTCRLTYTAGFSGIDDTGSIKVVMRYATDCGLPQFDRPQAPNYTTARASNGARLQLRYDPKDNLRPWGKTIHLKVVQGFLRQGDRIDLTLGDRSGGSPGWRIQTFVEKSFELRVLVDRFATYSFERLPDSPKFRVVAGEPVRLVAVAPTLAGAAEPIPVRSKLEDRWGNPVGRARKRVFPAFRAPGCHTLSVKDARTGLVGRTNPILVSRGERYGRYWADLHGQSEETIGTNSIQDYFRFGRDYGFLDICAHQGNDFQISDGFWKKIQATTRKFHEPGRLVTFPGWEWSGNTALGGDRNVLFREEGGPISRSSRALLSPGQAREPCCPTVEELFGRLRDCRREVMVLPHVGGRYADLSRHDPGLEWAVEVHSAWGTFEWMLADAFALGHRLAIVANSDGHKGRPGASYPGGSTFGSYGGLTCVLAKSLTRESVWEAYRARRVYATTGARIFLDVETEDGIPMGGLLTARSGSGPGFRIRVCGTAPIERVEVRNGMRVVKCFRTYTAADLSNRLKLLWEGAEVRGRGRQVTWNGSLTLSGNRIRRVTALNFHNPDHPCRQAGPTRLDWESITTGGVAGLVLELTQEAAGRVRVETNQTRFDVPLQGLGVQGRSWSLGGLDKRISVYRLPAAAGPTHCEFTFKLPARYCFQGDNPIVVKVVQEDGHMAWSSPIYVVKA